LLIFHEFDRLGVVAREAAHGRGIRTAIDRRPGAPAAPAGSVASQMLAQRLEDREAAQGLPALCLEGAEGFGAGISRASQMALAEIPVEKIHGPALQQRGRR